MSTTLLEIVTPDKVVLSEQINMLSIKTGGGELGILPRHAPLAATVKPCVARIKVDGGEDYVAVSGGFLEVLPDRITVLADTAEIGSLVDVERAMRARERAESRLNNKADEIDMIRAELAFRRALNRLEASDRSTQAGQILQRMIG